MADQTFNTTAVDWSDIGYQLATGLTKRLIESNLPKHVVSTLVEKEAVVQGVVFDVLTEIAIKAGEALHKLEGPFLPVIASFTAPIVSGLFGAEVNESTFARRMSHGDGAVAGQTIVAGLFKAIAGEAGGEVQPGEEGARRIAGAAVAASLESTFNAMIPELVSDIFPEIGHFEAFTELPENIIRTLGVSRLVRRALGPLVTATCTTPLQWHVNKTYRPELLSAGAIAKQIARGRGTKETWLEHLRRLGHSEANIEALLNEQRHYFSPGDVRTFVSREHWGKDAGLQHLRDQGYDEAAASDALRLEGLRRIDQLESAEAAVIIGAYAARDIDGPTFHAALNAAVSVESERALLSELAEVRRAMNVKRLTLSQVEAMVKSKVLSVIDYRRAAERDGYEPDAVDALELQLRYELDRDTAIEKHRAAQEAARLAEQQARDAAIAARRAEVAKQRALERRGSEADLERAVIRGLIPIARLEEVYAARYDADTIGILVADIEQSRAEYVAQQDARDQALKRAGRRAVDVGSLEQAVFENLLTLDEFRARLVALGFDAGDAELLRRTLEAKKRDRDAAETARIAAGAAAKKRKIDLGRFEDLVRRGHRTLAQYDALLESLGFEDAARAGMTELLELHIADDTKARAERAAAEARLKARGLSLEQFRRAVLLTIKTVDQFQTFLVDQGFTADAQRVLVAELRADVSEAEVARSRRAEAEARSEARAIPLADVRRAARLGVISVDAYRDRLDREGYTDEDVAVEIDLLVVEMAEAAATRAKAEAAARAAADRGLSLAQIARLVKFGLRSLDEYRAAVAAVYPNSADIEDLVTALQQELAALDAARVRRDQVESELATRDLSLSQLEAAVKDGLTTLDDYYAELLELGYGTDDAELLTVLLADRLDAAAAKRTA